MREAGALLRIECPDDGPVVLVDVELDERTVTVTLDAALTLSKRLPMVLQTADRFHVMEAKRTATDGP